MRCCQLTYKRGIYHINKHKYLAQQSQRRNGPERDRLLKQERKNGKARRKAAHSQHLAYERQARAKLRREAFEHYGQECACCGEKEDAFLSIDHINGGGNKHRKQVGSGTRFYKWLKNHNWPGGYRTLCLNCNWGSHRYGICPHAATPLRA